MNFAKIIKLLDAFTATLHKHPTGAVALVGLAGIAGMVAIVVRLTN